MPYPNLVMVGPAKTGTTSVFNWLAAHPDVLPSSIKETYFFHDADEHKNCIKKFDEKDFKQYAKYFSKWKNEKIIFEASPGYMSSESALKALHEINPDLKVLFIHRNPENRTYSEYAFHKEKTKRFNGSFEEYVGYENGNFTSFEVRESNYVLYLEKWVNQFGKENMILMHFNDMKHHPKEFMQKLADVLAIDPAFYESFSFSAKNKTMKIRSRFIHVLLLKIYPLIPEFILRIFTPLYYKMNSSKASEISESEKELKEKLHQYYLPMEEELMKKYGSLFI